MTAWQYGSLTMADFAWVAFCVVFTLWWVLKEDDK